MNTERHTYSIAESKNVKTGKLRYLIRGTKKNKKEIKILPEIEKNRDWFVADLPKKKTLEEVFQAKDIKQ